MTDEKSGIEAGVDGDRVQIQVDGRGTHLNSHLLKKFITHCLDDGRKAFELNLAGCTYMDSTFLGTLAGFGSKLKSRNLPKMQIINPSDRVMGMMEALGIDLLFEVVRKDQASSVDTMQKLSGSSPDKDVKSKEMLEAHEHLVQASAPNASKFRDVISLLKEEIQKNQK